MTMALFPGFSHSKVRTGGATINLVHSGRGPAVLMLHGYPETRSMSALSDWREVAVNVTGRPLDCGHFLPEETPAEVLAELRCFPQINECTVLRVANIEG